MARIVVIEDENDLRGVLTYNLGQSGRQVLGAATGAGGLRQVNDMQPELVLLDLMLPDLSGMEVCRMLKQSVATSHIPVMMLTARGDEQDRVTGFEVGAEDYLVKPFCMRELMLRIEVILNRSNQVVETALTEFGRLRFDRRSLRVWVDQEERSLTALEYRLLVSLHDSRDRVHSRRDLLRLVWKIEHDVVTRTVDTHVKRLRLKLGAAGDYIETVRGVGYRFTKQP